MDCIGAISTEPQRNGLQTVYYPRSQTVPDAVG